MAHYSNVLLFIILSMFICLVRSERFNFIETILIENNAPIVSVQLLPTEITSTLVAHNDGTISIWYNEQSFVIRTNDPSETEKLHSVVVDPMCSFQSSCRLFISLTRCLEEQSCKRIVSSSILQIDSITNEISIQQATTVNILNIDILQSFMNVGGSLVISNDGNTLFAEVEHHLFRVSIRSCNQQNYCIPSTNPYNNETFSWGFQNLTFCYWDKILYKPICIDSGSAYSDVVNVIYPRSNYGWPSKEADVCTNTEGNCNYPMYYEFPSAVISPVRRAISGFIYRGNSLDVSKNNRYFILSNNNIFSTGRFKRNTIGYFNELPIINLDTSVQNIKYMFQDASGDLYFIIQNTIDLTHSIQLLSNLPIY
jgi:hypothetical protein